MNENSFKEKALYEGSLAGSSSKGSSPMSIDREQLARCRSMANACIDVYASVEFIVKRILANGIDVRRDRMELTEEFKLAIEENLSTFVADTIRVALVVGVVPYRIITAGKFKHPKVAHDLIEHIHVALTPSGPKYSIEGKENHGVVFFEIFNNLTADGQLTSPASSLLRQYEILLTMECCAYIAADVAARPPVFLTNKNSGIDTTTILDQSGVNAEQEMQAQVIKNKIQMNVIKMQQMQMQYGLKGDEAEAAPFGSKRDRISGLPVIDYSKYSSFNPDYVVVPSDAQMFTHNVSSSPSDFHSTRESFKTSVSSVFGVPASALNGAATAQANSSAVTSSERATGSAISFMKRQLSRLCCKCLSVSYKEACKDVAVIFPPPLERATMDALYKDGILKEEFYKQYLSDELEIPLTAFNSEVIPPLVAAGLAGPNAPQQTKRSLDAPSEPEAKKPRAESKDLNV